MTPFPFYCPQSCCRLKWGEILSLTTLDTLLYLYRNISVASFLPYSSLSLIAQCCEPTSHAPAHPKSMAQTATLHSLQWSPLGCMKWEKSQDEKEKAKTKYSFPGASHATSLLKDKSSIFPVLSVPVSNNIFFILFFFFILLKMRHFRIHPFSIS